MSRLRQATKEEIYRYINDHPETAEEVSDIDGIKIVEGVVVIWREYVIAREECFKFNTETNEVIFED